MKGDAMEAPQNGLVTSRRSHQIYALEGGRRRWVPDLWTMREVGSTPAKLPDLEEASSRDMTDAEALPSSVPTPSLESLRCVESENATFEVRGGRLHQITEEEAQVIPPAAGFDKEGFLRQV